MDWLAAVSRLREQRAPGILLTLAHVRGHAPRNGGAKMVVAVDGTWGTVGGGNLEATAVHEARRMIADSTREPTIVTLKLSDKASAEFGVQCCGGEVTLLLEPLAVIPSVAIFGVGHVGLELARILSRHDLELFLIDSRAEMLADDRLEGITAGVARVHVHRAVAPEAILSELPAGTHVLVMTHDHAEDIAICDSALRREGVASIGLIGSTAKWTSFRKKLSAEGHSAADLKRITIPIGIPGLIAKEPAVIAVSVAAALLMAFEGPA
jgi:xanthine dehydrogenase accessory factor